MRQRIDKKEILPEEICPNEDSKIEIYEYYDIPLIYSYRSILGNAVIAYLADIDDDYTQHWIYSPVSESTRSSLARGKIPVKTAILNSINGTSYFVIEPGKPDIEERYMQVESKRITDDLLPDFDYFIGQ